MNNATMTIQETNGTTTTGWTEAKRTDRMIRVMRTNPERPGAAKQVREFSAKTRKEIGTAEVERAELLEVVDVFVDPVARDDFGDVIPGAFRATPNTERGREYLRATDPAVHSVHIDATLCPLDLFRNKAKTDGVIVAEEAA